MDTSFFTALYLTVNSNLRQFCWLHTKTGPSKVGCVATPPGVWTTSGRLPVGVSQQDLPRQSLLGHFEHMAEPK